MPTRRSNAHTSKSRCTSIRRPPDKTTTSGEVDPCSNADLLVANSTGTNRLSRPAEEAALLFLFQRCFFRCLFSVPKLNCRLRQNSLRRIPLIMNSATNSRTSARVRRLCAETFCSPLIEPLEHRQLLVYQVCWSVLVRRLPVDFSVLGKLRFQIRLAKYPPLHRQTSVLEICHTLRAILVPMRCSASVAITLLCIVTGALAEPHCFRQSGVMREGASLSEKTRNGNATENPNSIASNRRGKHHPRGTLRPRGCCERASPGFFRRLL